MWSQNGTSLHQYPTGLDIQEAKLSAILLYRSDHGLPLNKCKTQRQGND
jgi:hypothetical protein